MNMAGGTPTGRRVSTPLARHGISSSGKDKKESGKKTAMVPLNYVALPKDDSLSQNNSAIVSP